MLGALLSLAAGCDPEAGPLRLVGTVERDLIELVAPVSEVIVAVHVELGQAVAPGEILVELDATLARAELARSEAALAGARTGATVARHEHERIVNLRRRGVASEQDLERAEGQRDESRALLEEAEAGLTVARKRVADLSLAAPVAGVVDQLPFDAGERVPAGAVLAVVLGDGPPWVRVWLPEQSFVRVRPGTPARVRIDGLDGPLEGSVLDVARQPEFTPHYALTERDRVYLVYETRVRIESAPAELRPGVPAEVEILAAADGRSRP
ncbi:MAG TPA: efflux RND transporter periplasmic adaptor subunit [Myxococcota bacterium]|nr:efflux RND transporter periplasmic adaptor subunit [Myxococcota bacterium]